MCARKWLRASRVIQLSGWLLLVQSAGGIAQAAEPPPAVSKTPGVSKSKSVPASTPLSADEKIRKALASPTETDFVNWPLCEAVDYLATRHDVEIQFDFKALEELGVKGSTPVTRNLKGVSLRSALGLILEPLQLTYTIKNEVLLITSQEKVSADLTTKVYPVADLVLSDQPGGAQDKPDFDSLVEIITSIVKPSTWDAVGGPGSIAGLENRLCLVVSQTDDVHEHISRLLQLLRRLPRSSPEGAMAADGKPKAPLPASISAGDDNPLDEQIRKALAAPSEAVFKETPLSEALDSLKKRHKIEIQLDTKALEGLGVATDAPISKNLKGISLQSVLKLILEPLQLTHTIKNEVLLITAQDKVNADLTTKIYPVADLLFPADATTELTGGMKMMSILGPVPRGTTEKIDARGRGPQFDVDSLIELITSTVGVTTWDAVGGPSSIAGFSYRSCLIVSQTQDVHQQISDLLEKLRSLPRARRYGVEDPAQVLECKAQTDIDKMPLAKLVDFLKERYLIKIELDEKAIAAAGARPDTPVSGHIAGAAWRSALHQLLGQVKLGFIVKNHTLLITSQERASRELVTVIYGVSDLAMVRNWWGGQVADFKPLLAAITTTVKPNSWTAKGGPGAATAIESGCRLVISQTQEVQEEIAELLQKLREASPAAVRPTGAMMGLGGGMM